MLPTVVRSPRLLDEVLEDTRTVTARQAQGQTGAQADNRGLAGFGRRGASRFGNGDRVPEERLLLGAPLHFELICSGAARRPPEVEPAEPVAAAGPNRLPIQEHVRTISAVLGEAR